MTFFSPMQAVIFEKFVLTKLSKGTTLSEIHFPFQNECAFVRGCWIPQSYPTLYFSVPAPDRDIFLENFSYPVVRQVNYL